MGSPTVCKHRMAHYRHIDKILHGDIEIGGEEIGLFPQSSNRMMHMSKSGLSAMTLRTFISMYGLQLEEYYDEYFGAEHRKFERIYGDRLVFVMVDTSEVEMTRVPSKIQKKVRRVGKRRRDKLRHQWAYINPMNRIHGFLILKEVTNKNHTEKTYAIDTVASSYFSEKKGVGSDLITLAKIFSQKVGAKHLVLEVANEYSACGFSDSEDEESEDESDEESEEESEEDYEEESERSRSNTHTIWFPDYSSLDIICKELWKKCMRKNHEDIPYYNLSLEYIDNGIQSYFNAAMMSEDGDLWSGTSEHIVKDVDEPGETEYGGFWYQKGRRSQIGLMRFYERFGFVEDPEVFKNWCCFYEVPYPTMRVSF